jgi:energy-coupling factor transporter ATP-binding protein EcfA2
MSPEIELNDIETAVTEAREIFGREIGVPDVKTRVEEVGNRTFLKFIVGRPGRVYDRALRNTQKRLPSSNPFRGLLNLAYLKQGPFPQSLEADVLQNILTGGTRYVVREPGSEPPLITNVPFQNREDHKIVQPATHLIIGRRGVGKSTLIARAAELLNSAKKLYVVLDMQPFAELCGDALIREVLHEFADRLAESIETRGAVNDLFIRLKELKSFAGEILKAKDLPRSIPELNRILKSISAELASDIFFFLDDYHLIEHDQQPKLLNTLHGALKGANGWLKVSGLRTQLNAYDAKTRRGLQVPGDAQLISLDFTLVDPEQAERHLRAILQSFLSVIGVSSSTVVINDEATMRLVWANAGVPRDFLQMFGRALDHAHRASRSKITLTDVNLAIGEAGQRKMDELEQDARNEQNILKDTVAFLETFCLSEKKINGFLVRSEQTPERRGIEVLSDLRLVHLIHQTITPHKAGERYEAYLIDYSLFTGFRRRPGISELLPEDRKQFKAKELRKLPELPKHFLQGTEA